ncbi:glycosyltransferase [Sphingomonas sp. R86521]|uniref:glycosyltransferase n=1 Tax=Sphingomonas sp. R86521 TaxID=3093860 RepID=UPI0036D3710E
MQANAARDAGDWSTAANYFAAIVAARPDAAPMIIQHAHMAKEAGDVDAAEDAYRRAAALMPGSTDALWHLAEMLRHAGRPADAQRAYGEVLRRDGSHPAAARMLAEIGGRSNLPDCAITRAAQGALLGRIGRASAERGAAVEAWLGGGLFPTGAYDAFRSAYPVQLPPVLATTPIHVRIDAAAASPAMVRATVQSLIDQSHGAWTATVLASASLLAHPVAGMADRDSRIRFTDAQAAGNPDDGLILVTGAGVVFDGNALAWYRFAEARSGAALLFANHDRVTRDWIGGETRLSPALFGYFDVDMIAATNDPPIAVLVTPSASAEARSASGAGLALRTLVLTVAADGAVVVHIPRILASVLRLPDPARGAPVGAAEAAIGPGEIAPADPAEGVAAGRLAVTRRSDGMSVASVVADAVTPAPIAVLIPTRDSPDMLARCVASLRARAARPDLLDLIVLDNRSTTAAAREVFDRLSASGDARVVAHDAPFNWSRMNNRLIDLSTAETCVFANDDVTMLTDGWDRQAAGFCARADVGAVGARLLYPDGGYQHGGVVLGVSATQLSVHEGLGHVGDSGGPGDRWLRTRAVAAVTGAFLATTRTVLTEVDGFDEDLALAYNDIDYCFRVRATGRKVLYTPALSLTHHESPTRGRNTTRDRIAWDEGELQTLAERWGGALRWDPAYDLHWALRGLPFDGYREPSMSEILDRIDRGAGASPWSVVRSGR